MQIAKATRSWLHDRLARVLQRVRRVRFVRRSRILGRLERLGRALSRNVLERARRPRRAERSIRRQAEKQRGGLSTAESAARYSRGENRGGTHGGRAVHFDGPEHERPRDVEPQARDERVPGGHAHMSEHRGGN